MNLLQVVRRSCRRNSKEEHRRRGLNDAKSNEDRLVSVVSSSSKSSTEAKYDTHVLWQQAQFSEGTLGSSAVRGRKGSTRRVSLRSSKNLEIE